MLAFGLAVIVLLCFRTAGTQATYMITDLGTLGGNNSVPQILTEHSSPSLPHLGVNGGWYDKLEPNRNLICSVLLVLALAAFPWRSRAQTAAANVVGGCETGAICGGGQRALSAARDASSQGSAELKRMRPLTKLCCSRGFCLFGSPRRSVILGSICHLDSRVLAAECLARNVRVPVHERPVGILLPRPDMQRVERREPKTIGGFEQMKKLPH